VFIHDAIRDFVICGDTEIESTCLLAHVTHWREKYPGHESSRFNEEFMVSTCKQFAHIISEVIY